MTKRNKSLLLSDAVLRIVKALAERRELSESEAAEHLIKVGDTRIRTLRKHTEKRTRERRATKKSKKIAKVLPITGETGE
jgi:protein subunit release factor B